MGSQPTRQDPCGKYSPCEWLLASVDWLTRMMQDRSVTTFGVTQLEPTSWYYPLWIFFEKIGVWHFLAELQ